MRNFIRNDAANVIFSGLLTAFAASQANFILSGICFIPLFIVLTRQAPKQSAKSGLLFGLTISLTCFYWMVPGAVRFTGSSALYGVLVYFIATIVLTAYFTLLIFCFAKLKISFSLKTGTVLLNGLLAACLFTVFEYLLMQFSRHMPWFEFHSGMGLAANSYAIQPAEYFGIHVLSFFAILVNYLLAGFLVTKSWGKQLIPTAICGLYLLAGYISTPNSVSGAGVKVAILAQNLPPETKWSENTGDALAQNILDLDSTAALMKPDIALWSESVIPWTYRKDDDLVSEILRLSKPAGTTHIIGINTDAGNNAVYNSVYGITPDGKITGRFDKQVLLSFIEQRFAGILFPFLSNDGDEARSGSGGRVLKTPYGKAGIIVCNEATVPSAAYDAVKQGAGYILNLSNDGWFSKSYLVDLHFYHVRLRAVETRRDIVVNSNDGYSGMVKASGEIVMQKKSPASFVDMTTVVPHTGTTLVVKMPLLFIYLCLGGILYFIIAAIIASRKHAPDVN